MHAAARRFSWLALALFGTAVLAAPPAETLPMPVEEKAISFPDRIFKYVEDDQPVLGPEANAFEYQGYMMILRHAREISVERLAKEARREVTYKQLYERGREKYRGQVVHVEGRLRRVRAFKAPAPLREDGIDKIYEGWVFPDKPLSLPYCVLFTEKPAALSVNEDLELTVRYDGFFFKRYRYQASDGPRVAPLLLGRTISVIEAKPSKPTPPPEKPQAGLPPLTAGLLLSLLAAPPAETRLARSPGDCRVHRPGRHLCPRRRSRRLRPTRAIIARGQAHRRRPAEARGGRVDGR